MNLGRLESFVHKGQPQPSPRAVPAKLLLNNSVPGGYRFSNGEPSDQGSHRGAFSTDLESYPDTSTDNTQHQFIDIRQLKAPEPSNQQSKFDAPDNTGRVMKIESDTNVSAKVDLARGFEGSPMSGPKVSERVALTSLLGPDDTQEFEAFGTSWDEDQKNIAQLAMESESTSASGEDPKFMKPRGPTSEGIENTQRAQVGQSVSNVHLRPLAYSGDARKSNDVHPSDSTSQPLPPNIFNRFAIRRLKARVNNLYAQQSDVPILPTNEDNLPGPRILIPDQTPVEQNRSSTERTTLPPHRATLTDRSVQTINERERWKLKRKASLSDVKTDLSDAEILKLPYSELESTEVDSSENNSKSTATPEDLEEWIAGISGDNPDSNAMFTRMTSLSSDHWAGLGNTLSKEHNEIITKLKNLRERKREISAAFEKEIGQTMQQVHTNERIVEGRLLKLRSYGTQMLNGASTLDEAHKKSD